MSFYKKNDLPHTFFAHSFARLRQGFPNNWFPLRIGRTSVLTVCEWVTCIVRILASRAFLPSFQNFPPRWESRWISGWDFNYLIQRDG